MKNHKYKWIRLTLKIILWLLTGITALIVLLIILVQVPAVQNYAAQKVVNYLKNKIKSEVTLNSISIGFPKTVNINELYIAGLKKDTLLYAHKVNVSIDMFGLLKKRIFIKSVEMDGITARIYRLYPDTAFNYSFIADAFSTPTSPDTVTSSGKPMVIDVKDIKLNHIRLLYSDTLSGLKASVYIGAFSTSLKTFSTDKMIFDFNDITLDNSSLRYLQTPPLVKSVDTSQSVMPQIGFKRFLLTHFNMEYASPASGNQLVAAIGNLEVHPEKVTLSKRLIRLSNVLLENSSISFNQSKPQHFDTIVAQVVKKPGSEKQIATPQWVFFLKDMQLKNNKFNFNNFDSINKKQGIDFNHLAITELNLDSKDISVNPGNISMDLHNLSFAEKSGFRLDKFKSAISYDTTNITLNNLEIATPNSHISNHLEANFKSITAIAKSIEKIVLNINLENSSIAATDILYIVPQLEHNPQFSLHRGEVFSLQGNIKGSLEKLLVDRFSFKNNMGTVLSLSGTVVNLMKPDQLYASLSDMKFSTSRKDILTYLPASMIPASLTIPEAVSLNGNFKGYLKNFDANIDLNTTFGDVNAQVKMNPDAGNIPAEYHARVDVNRFDLGKLLNKPDTLGPVSLVATADGFGTDPKHLNTYVHAIVSEAFYNKYTYHDLNLEGFVVNSSFHGEVWMHDDNLDFDYTGYANLLPDSLAFLFDFVLNGADLKALNFSTDEFKIKGAISSDLAKRYGPNPLGKVKIYDVRLVKKGFDCPVDSLVIQSTYDKDSSLIEVRSQFLSAVLKGDIVLQSLPETLETYVNRYFAFSDIADTTVYDTTLVNGKKVKQSLKTQTVYQDDTQQVPQNFSFNITVEDPNRICENLMPALKKFMPISISGRYNSTANTLLAKAEIPMIDYNNILINSLLLDIKSNNQKFDYNLHISEISNPSLAIQQFDFTGDIANNKITYDIKAQKADTFNVLKTSGALEKKNKDYILILDEPLILNNTAWRMDPDNKITFSSKGMNAQKVVLTGENQEVSIITQPGDNVPLKVAFKDFKLSNISLIIEKDKELARGILNGNFILVKTNGVKAFTSDLKIDSLHFMEVPVGNISLLASNSKNPEQFDLDFKLTGYDNDLSAKGYYLTHDSVGSINVKVDIPRLNMSAIEPFTFGQVTRMSGFINGGFDIQGSLSKPDVIGRLQTNQVAFNAPYADTYLKVDDNVLNINNHRLLINDLTLKDSLNNTAKLNGYADFTNLTRPVFDLRVVTQNFLAMNSKVKKENIPVYGKVILDSDIHLTGTPTSPIVIMNVKLNNGTEVTYVMPENQILLNESEGIVVFSDNLDQGAKVMAPDTTKQSIASVEGISMNAIIKFEPNAVLKMLIDPVAGDSLYVKGEGTLNFSLEPGGQMNLSGKYDIANGAYNLTLNDLIKRKFNIKEGSSITWNGDVMDATVDMIAIYTVRTSAALLIEDQLASMEESQRVSAMNTLTFYVNLKMEGPLTTPKISFDIEQPENEKNAMNGLVNAKLNELKTDETQMNKQVFALLALNRFLGQDPFETGNAPLTVESATRASASKLLTQQFSALSQKYIKGVDLDVGVNSFEDYSTGKQQGRTQLQLGLKKELLNNRVTVQVGGNVDVEGQQASNNKASDIAGNVKIEYKLTPDGRFRLKGYSRTEFQNPIEGELVNTGIGISYTRDFRKIRQIFMSKKSLAKYRDKRNAEIDNQLNKKNESKNKK